MVVVIQKEIGHPVRNLKTAFFIEGDCQRAVACANQKPVAAPSVMAADKLHHPFPIALVLRLGDLSLIHI